MQAISGQIELYKIHLRGVNINYTFRNFAKDYCYEGGEEQPDENTLFTALFEKLLNQFDLQVNRYDDLKKGVSIYHADGVDANTILSIATDQKVIQGFLDGGYFGLKRNMSNLDKSNPTIITTDKIVTDSYYVYMYYPLDSNIGILMIEKRGNQTISKVVCNVLEAFFNKQNNHISSHVERFIPRSMVQNFKQGAIVDHLTYSRQVSSAVLGEGVIDDSELYDVTIQIKPRSKDYSYARLDALVTRFNAMTFKVFGHEFNLGGFTTKKGKLRSEDSNSKPSFDLEDQSLRVTKPIPQEFYDEFNTLDRERMKNFCGGLLHELSAEVYPVAPVENNDGVQ